ncbi:MAG: T9SS C-terminal target domain-containing protein, partial [Calditrichaeota bacterium]
AIYQDVVLQGSILIDTHVNFEGQVVNQGILKVPDGFQTSAQITARGTFINQGTLAPNNFNKLLFFKLDGDLDNQGDWQTQELSYLGAGPYVLKTDTSKVFQPGSFLAWQGTPWMPTIVVSGSPLRIDGGLVKLKKLVLQPGHDLQLNQHVTLAVDTLEGNGNHIRSDGAYTIDQGPHNNAVIQSVSLEDTSRFNHPTSFSGSIFNQGVMEEASSISWVLTFHDDFHNLGFIIPNSSTTKLRFVLEGDMENAGFWQSGSVDLKGTGTNKLEGVGSQKVAIPDSNNFQATLNAWAMRTGSSYQWEKDGSAVSNGGHLSGATTSILSFSKVAPGDYGSYRCRIDSSGQTIFSRDVIIGDVLTGIEPEDGGLPGVSALPTRFELGQNYPNPFNPTTTIPYALPQASPVRLVLYDALGRQVAVLVDGHQAAGRHQVRLDASQLAAGIYFYRLQAGPFVQMKKLVLIK